GETPARSLANRGPHEIGDPIRNALAGVAGALPSACLPGHSGPFVHSDVRTSRNRLPQLAVKSKPFVRQNSTSALNLNCKCTIMTKMADNVTYTRIGDPIDTPGFIPAADPVPQRPEELDSDADAILRYYGVPKKQEEPKRDEQPDEGQEVAQEASQDGVEGQDSGEQADAQGD